MPPETRPAPGSPAALVKWALGKWSIDFPASFPDATMARARELSLRELLAAHPWVSAPILERAVYLVRWQHEGPFLPGPALLLDFFEAAARELEREAQSRRAKLPPPAPPSDDERQEEEDRITAVKLRARLSLPERLRVRRKR